MSKSSKYILASGCSFTCTQLISPVVPREESMFTRWPELLGQKLNLPVKNLAESGRNNAWIYKGLVRELLNNHSKIELVVVGWSEPSRYDLWSYDFNTMDTYFNLTEEHKKKWAAHPNKELRDAAENFHHHIYQAYVWTQPYGVSVDNIICKQIIETFKYMLDLQRLCELLKIPLIMSSMLGRLNPYQVYRMFKDSKNCPDHLSLFDPKVILHFIINQDIVLDINKKYCIGYPFIKTLGGFDFHCDVITRDSDLQIHDLDPHPNKQGHELIADTYYEHYKKNFT